MPDPRALSVEELAAIRDRKEHTPVTLLDERFTLLAHIAALERQVAEAREENERLTADLAFIRDGWSEFGAKACPACVYVKGVFQRRCKVHEWAERAVTMTTIQLREALARDHDRNVFLRDRVYHDVAECPTCRLLGRAGGEGT